jgi:glycosyltransferase involved in cell wall biosynthesis
MKLGIVVPVCNAEKTIIGTLERLDNISEVVDIEVLIIDNKSQDSTISLINETFVEKPSLKQYTFVVAKNQNDGYGRSIKQGFDHFLSRDVSHIVVIHGDLQEDPYALINRQLDYLAKNSSTNVVLASRFFRESDISSYSLKRRIGNHFFNLFTKVCTGQVLSDFGTAMLCISKESLSNIEYSRLSDSWHFHPQLNIIFCETPEISIGEVELNWKDSEGGSSVQLIRYGLTLLKILSTYWWIKNIKRKPLSQRFNSPE